MGRIAIENTSFSSFDFERGQGFAGLAIIKTACEAALELPGRGADEWIARLGEFRNDSHSFGAWNQSFARSGVEKSPQAGKQSLALIHLAQIEYRATQNGFVMHFVNVARDPSKELRRKWPLFLRAVAMEVIDQATKFWFCLIAARLWKAASVAKAARAGRCEKTRWFMRHEIP